MKYHIALKFLAILLCALCLLSALASGAGIAALSMAELYSRTPAELCSQWVYDDFAQLADHLARKHAVKTYSNLVNEEPARFFRDFYGDEVEEPDQSLWHYRLYDSSGKLLEARYDGKAVQGAVKVTYPVTVYYPVILDRSFGEEPAPVPVETLPEATTDPQTATTPEETTDPPGESAQDAEKSPLDLAKYSWTQEWQYWDTDGVLHRYLVGILYAPSCSVELFLQPGAYEEPDHWAWELVKLGYAHRIDLIWILGASLLLFAVLLVFLCCAAGRKPGTKEVQPAALNRLPLDLYLGGLVVAISTVTVIAASYLPWWLNHYEPVWLVFAAVGAAALVCCLLVVGFLFACAAQMKVPGGWWLKHTVVGFVLVTVFRILRWIFKKLGQLLRWLWSKLPAVKKPVRKLAGALWWVISGLFKSTVKVITALYRVIKSMLLSLFSLLGKAARLLWRALRRFLELLPLTWQWFLGAFVMVFVIAVAVQPGQPTLVIIGCLGICVALVMYGTYCFGSLLESTKRMSRGDLDTKVEDKLLLGSFREYAVYLNALAHVATEAARQQMKSERMKAELITNVSHDIKTPLTSIINYVDLLQKAGSPQETEQYLEVLDRQSQRLKKLIEDLMEMSKASTGNMAVDLGTVDAAEAVTQALGEFSEKLEQAQLIPVFDPPAAPVKMTADGRLTWRVLSNLLSNAVKYALPGTRLYIGVEAAEDTVQISLKNISREQLNVSADELLERFVRGDASRNTEGSGLGLNIARSLMELQKGQLRLLVDGDLFKVTLIFTPAP